MKKTTYLIIVISLLITPVTVTANDKTDLPQINKGEIIELTPEAELYQVVRVIDGDTIVVQIGEELEKIRLIGINAPESDECFGPMATDKLKELVEGKEVKLLRDFTNSDRDRYGRLLRYVKLDDSTFVNAVMVQLGFARAYLHFPFMYQVEFAQYQEDATDANLGIWDENACQEKPVRDAIIEEPVIDILENDRLQIIDIFYDGTKGPNEPDEYVLIQNITEAQVDMTSFTLTDAAGKRYRFGRFVLAAQGTVKVFTGCGVDTENFVYWCHEKTAVWNNTGDTAYLRDDTGDLVDVYSYNNNQSDTRSDLEPIKIGR